MDHPYITGHDQGCDYATGGRRLSINMNNFNNITGFQQQQSFPSQGSPSPLNRSRHDSVNSQMSLQALQLSSGQHQAGSQPCGQQLTPHTGITCPIQSTPMSRGTSHASHHSSTSSSQQYGGDSHLISHHSFPNFYSPLGTNMQRSRSGYSTNSAMQSHQTSPQSSAPQMYPAPANQYDPHSSIELLADFPIATQHSPTNNLLHNFSVDCTLNEPNGIDGFGNGVFGHDLSDNLMTLLDCHFGHHNRPHGLDSKPS
ncbi:hypothetical protein C7974DRAFT_9584 [Boeremia exigua]|uniref:uncharacterized protein n=1 Tax=Boeremia exigua TaxID=749465 RepID=UPI001E8ED5C6|nr:uncharacterized protein C7974DRAFT_9584 [Boeremia exigua]KAH6643914.1 hypothetical protein C7974DRAFT_9584 [Boeremia exigua]